MLIHCKAQVNTREITFGRMNEPESLVKYLFEKNEAGHLVCEVGNKAHAERLLAIPEHYEQYDPDKMVEAIDPGSSAPAVLASPAVPKKRAEPKPEAAPENVGARAARAEAKKLDDAAKKSKKRG